MKSSLIELNAGRALRVAVGMAALVLLMAGGAEGGLHNVICSKRNFIGL